MNGPLIAQRTLAPDSVTKDWGVKDDLTMTDFEIKSKTAVMDYPGDPSGYSQSNAWSALQMVYARIQFPFRGKTYIPDLLFENGNLYRTLVGHQQC